MFCLAGWVWSPDTRFSHSSSNQTCLLENRSVIQGLMLFMVVSLLYHVYHTGDDSLSEFEVTWGPSSFIGMRQVHAHVLLGAANKPQHYIGQF